VSLRGVPRAGALNPGILRPGPISPFTPAKRLGRSGILKGRIVLLPVRPVIKERILGNRIPPGPFLPSRVGLIPGGLLEPAFQSILDAITHLMELLPPTTRLLVNLLPPASGSTQKFLAHTGPGQG
jgi:hypothetical protein